MNYLSHTETFHGVDDEVPVSEALEKFRIRFCSIKVNVEDGFMVYGPYNLKFKDSEVKKASEVISDLGLDLRAETHNVGANCFTLVIKGV